MSLVIDINAIVEESNDPLLSSHPTWARAPLSQVASVLNGYPFESRLFSKDRGMPLIRIRDIDQNTTSQFFDGEYDPSYIVRSGDVLVGMDGEFKAAIWRGDAALLNQRVCKLTPNEAFYNSRFLALVLPGYLTAIHDRTSSQTVKHLSSRTISEIPLPLPSLGEQTRIVEKAASLLDCVDRAKARLDRVTKLLKRFRQSVFNSACTGQLTASWREQGSFAGGETADPLKAEQRSPHDSSIAIPDNWEWVQFGEMVTSLRSGTTTPPQNEETAHPVLRSSSVRPLTVDLDDAKFLPATAVDTTANYIEDDDLLFTRLSGSLEYVANCARVTGVGSRRVQFPDRLFRARLKTPAFGPYFELAFASPLLRRSLEVASKSSAGHQRISMGALTDYWIPLPPAEEIAEIVKRTRVLLALADTIERRVAVAAARADKLPQSILAKAFSGELVPTEAELARAEGRPYESAESLLRRLAPSPDSPPPKRPRSPRKGR
ncbi:MAG: restriction endonuclease subunit S [Polyangiaceae bacterium]